LAPRGPLIQTRDEPPAYRATRPIAAAHRSHVLGVVSAMSCRLPSVAVPLITEWKLPEAVAENCAVPAPWITLPAGSCEQARTSSYSFLGQRQAPEAAIQARSSDVKGPSRSSWHNA